MSSVAASPVRLDYIAAVVPNSSPRMPSAADALEAAVSSSPRHGRAGHADEQPRPTVDVAWSRATRRTGEMAGVLASRSIVERARHRAELCFLAGRDQSRSISERASVEAKDDFARTIINDLIAASSTEQHQSELGRP